MKRISHYIKRFKEFILGMPKADKIKYIVFSAISVTMLFIVMLSARNLNNAFALHEYVEILSVISVYILVLLYASDKFRRKRSIVFMVLVFLLNVIQFWILYLYLGKNTPIIYLIGICKTIFYFAMGYLLYVVKVNILNNKNLVDERDTIEVTE